MKKYLPFAAIFGLLFFDWKTVLTLAFLFWMLSTFSSDDEDDD